MAVSQVCRSAISRRSPGLSDAGANGCCLANSAQVIGSISAAALSFIVHEPSGIMLRSSAMSLSAKARRYRIIEVSVRYRWKAGCVRNSEVRVAIIDSGAAAGADSERVQHRSDMLIGGGLVAGHRHVVGVDPPQVDAGGLGRGHDVVGAAGHPGQHGVEVGRVHQRISQGRSDRRGVPVHAAGDGGQPGGAVVAGVHGGDDGQQHLRGADVAGRLVPADVLLAGLQAQAIGVRAIAVHGHPDQPARQLAGMLGVHGQVPGVRSTESHWHTETLGGAEGHVGAELAGRGDQRRGQQVGADGDQRATFVRLVDQTRPVGDTSAGARQLHDDAEEITLGQALAQVGRDRPRCRAVRRGSR